VIDNTNLYIELLRKILAGESPGYGKNGYYLASPGSVAWDDLYESMARALVKRHIIADASVTMANDQNLEEMAQGLGNPKEFVAFQLGGK
jgi:hypothetical protein